jgi:hypothetical protein
MTALQILWRPSLSEAGRAIDPFDFAQGRLSIVHAVLVNRPYLFATTAFLALKTRQTSLFIIIINP